MRRLVSRPSVPQAVACRFGAACGRLENVHNRVDNVLTDCGKTPRGVRISMRIVCEVGVGVCLCTCVSVERIARG